ncbi:MAG: sugar phosphate nucleotidyltransferase [Verrucomicrobiota bacterium]
MKALILAAGKGTRMRELTESLPKPMVQVKGVPILERIITGLRDAAGITEFFLIVGYKKAIVMEHFGDGSRLGVAVTYGEQVVQDGTGKAPEIAKEWIGADRFLMSYGDILIDAPDYAFLASEFTGAADGVIALKAGEDLKKGGAVVLNDEGWMKELIEKTDNPPPNAYYNAGIYLLSPEIFRHTAALEKSARGEYEFTDALTGMVAAGGKLKGVQLRQSWVDVRDPEVLAKLNES